MSNFTIHKLSSDNGWVVGFSIMANPVVKDAKPAKVIDGSGETDVPLQFYTGNVNSIRAQLHKLVDDALDELAEIQKT